MLETNLLRAIELRNKIKTYNNFIGRFSPVTEEEFNNGIINPLGQVSFSASYVPGVKSAEGVEITAGRWVINSQDVYGNAEILKIVNDIASEELSTIGSDIVSAIIAKIQEAQTEFDSL